MFYNHFVIPILKSPLHGILSGNTMLVTYTGTRSGRQYTVPVNFVAGESAGTLLATSLRNRVWWRNFHQTQKVILRLRGVEHPARATAFESENDTRAGLEEIFRCNPGYARYFKLSVEENGKPDPVRLAEIAAGMVVVRFQLDGQESL